MGLISLAETHPFRALNDACQRALMHGAWRLQMPGILPPWAASQRSGLREGKNGRLEPPPLGRYHPLSRLSHRLALP